jgi:hypothetical protein
VSDDDTYRPEGYSAEFLEKLDGQPVKVFTVRADGRSSRGVDAIAIRKGDIEIVLTRDDFARLVLFGNALIEATPT